MTEELTKEAQQALEALKALLPDENDPNHDGHDARDIRKWRALVERLRALTRHHAAQAAGEREAFEAEMRCEETWGHRSLKKRTDGRYQNWQVDVMWGVWQRRAALPTQPAAQAKQSDLDRRYSDGWNDCLNRYVNRPAAMALAHKEMFGEQRAAPEPLTSEQIERHIGYRLPAHSMRLLLELIAPQATPEPEWETSPKDGEQWETSPKEATTEPVGEARCSTCGVTMNEPHHPACGAVTAAIIGLNTMAAQDKEARRRELAEKIRETLRGVFTHPAPGVPEWLALVPMTKAQVDRACKLALVSTPRSAESWIESGIRFAEEHHAAMIAAQAKTGA